MLLKILRHFIAPTLATALALISSYSIAEEIVSESSHGQLKLVLVESAPHNYVLNLENIGIKLQSAFVVENPNRLVIDITANNIKAVKSPPLLKKSEISGIRLGVHSDKTRIVLDLNTTTAPIIKTQAADNKVAVRFTFSDDAKDNQKVSEQVKVESAPTPLPSLIPATATAVHLEVPQITNTIIESSPTAKPTLAPSATFTPKHIAPTPEPTKLSPPAPTQIQETLIIDPSKQELAGVFFEREGNDQKPILRIALSQKGEFKFSRSDDHLYELFLTGYSLASSRLGLPYFPPQDFNGLVYIQASNRNGGVKLLIGVERGIKLSPITKGTDIFFAINQ